MAREVRAQQPADVAAWLRRRRLVHDRTSFGEPRQIGADVLGAVLGAAESDRGAA